MLRQRSFGAGSAPLDTPAPLDMIEAVPSARRAWIREDMQVFRLLGRWKPKVFFLLAVIIILSQPGGGDPRLT
jgi:hypothetical protein